MHSMLESVMDGTRADGIEDVTVVVKAALEATAVDALGADGYIIGTPANLGYMSGAMKHFFDLAYYPIIETSLDRPFGLYLHGDDDASGAAFGVEKIATGLRWRRVAANVDVSGKPSRDDLDACWNLGATVAANLSEGR